MNRTIRKRICLLLALALALSLTGCDFPIGGKPQVSEQVGETEQPAETEQPSDDPEADPDGSDATDEPEGTEEPEPSEDGENQSGTGRELQATYQADHIFSINSMPGESFDPYTTDSAWNRVAAMLVYETLVAADEDFEAQPNLITSWDSQDGVTWTFHVDTARQFHDGGTMTAGDAVYSIELGTNGYSQYGKRFSHVTDVYTVDASTFVVQLNAPNWRFYELLNIPCIEIGTAGIDHPPGTGPYMFNARGTALVRFDDHPNADELPLKTIHLKRYTDSEDILQAFEDSLLDMVTNNPADMSSLGYSSANLIKYVDTTNMHFLGYNYRSAIFSQPIYRALVTYAIDRDSIISTSYQGSAEAATLPIHPGSALYPRSFARTLGYSPENLATSLENAGARDDDGDGVLDLGAARGEITLLVCSDSAAKVAAARQIGNQLHSAGFLVTMMELEYEDYLKALEAGNYDIYYGEVKICNDWDITELVGANGTLNYGGVRDPNLEGYIQAFLASTDDAVQENAATLYNYLAQCAPITTICFERQQVLYHRGVLTTISPTQDNIFNRIEDWTVDLGGKEK